MNRTIERDHGNYRDSHASAGYGAHYEETYRRGYYSVLWDRVERPLLEDVFTQLSKENRRKCLDFACGTGRITAVAERYFENTVGVDVSAAMLEIARKKVTRAKILTQDITRTPIDEKFDVVLAFRFVLNAEPKLRLAAIRALRDVMTRDGRMIINVHVNRSSILGLIYRIRNRITRRHIANTLGFDELQSLLSSLGLRVERTIYYGLFPRLGWRFEWLQKALIRPFEILFRSVPLIPRRIAQSFIVVCYREEGESESSKNDLAS